MSTTIRNLLALAVHPVLWRFIGFVSSLVGLICYAASSPFNKLFHYGVLGLLVIVIYCALGSFVCCTMLCTPTWGLKKNFVLKAHVVFFVLMVTSVYSFYHDKTEEGKEKKVSDKVLNLISCGAFALMSLSLSRLSGLGFEAGMFNFFLGSVMMAVMKWNIKFALASAIFCLILIGIRTYLDSLLEANNQSIDIEAELALLPNGPSESNVTYSGSQLETNNQSSDIVEAQVALTDNGSSEVAVLIPLPLRPEVIYDVFISYSAKDTIDIPAYLAGALRRKSLSIYTHQELPGDEIPPTVVRAIEGSKVSVIIVSQSYIDTKWCLDELYNIMACRARYAHIVIPVFYNIDRATVDQYSLMKFSEVTIRKENSTEKLRNWYCNLHEATTLQGWEMLQQRSPYELLEDVANHALSAKMLAISSNATGGMMPTT